MLVTHDDLAGTIDSDVMCYPEADHQVLDHGPAVPGLTKA